MNEATSLTAQRAEDIWRTMDRTPECYRGTDIERLFKLAAEHFAEVYQCARGHKIDPAYISALPFDFLQALAAVVKAHEAVPDKEAPC